MKEEENVEVSLKEEAKSKMKMLEGLRCAIKQRETEAGWRKRVGREGTRAEKEKNTTEGDRKEVDDNEAVACVKVWMD